MIINNFNNFKNKLNNSVDNNIDNEKMHGIGILFNKNNEEYPLVRHFTSYESAISIIENKYLMSRKNIKNNIENLNENIIKNKNLNSNDNWWCDRKKLELMRFKSEDIIYCTVDWFNDSKYETGHGPVMIYFKPKIFEKFKITLTIEDSLTENRDRIYDKYEISKIYSKIINNNSNDFNFEAEQILKNLNHKNAERYYHTSNGVVFIPERFYDKYSEIQIHTDKISIEYIKELRFTNNYFIENENDDINKEKLIQLCKKNNIKIV